MSEISVGPSLQTVLGGHLPLKSNGPQLAALARPERALVVLALAPGRGLDEAMLAAVHEVVLSQTHAGVDLVMGNLGEGGAESWRLVSMLRDHFEHLRALVPFTADAGATLVALGADELELSSVACLSIDNADPWRLTVARRCLETHLAPKHPEVIASVLDALAPTLAGPTLPLTRRDLELRLGLAVDQPEPGRWSHLRDLHAYYQEMLSVEGDLALDGHHFLVSYDGFIDTLDTRRALIRVTRADEQGRPMTDRKSLSRWVKPHGRDLVLDEEQSL